jgi:hypothetical protein
MASSSGHGYEGAMFKLTKMLVSWKSSVPMQSVDDKHYASNAF